MNNCDQLSEHQRMALSIILSDCYTYTAIIRSLNKDISSYFWLGITPYVALAVKEADNWLGKTRMVKRDLSASTKKHIELLRGKIQMILWLNTHHILKN